LFENLRQRFPSAPLTAQVELAIARTYELQRDWSTAEQAYMRWLAAHPAAPERPQVEYAAAWTCYRAGDVTNALARFTRFIETYPTNTLARRPMVRG
jgi:outer membrane protein assembly factor BamD (BamD/ComL family)